MIRWLKSFILREVVAEVPPEMAHCLDCRKLECTEGTYQACAARKALAKEIIEASAGEGVEGGPAG